MLASPLHRPPLVNLVFPLSTWSDRFPAFCAFYLGILEQSDLLSHTPSTRFRSPAFRPIFLVAVPVWVRAPEVC